MLVLPTAALAFQGTTRAHYFIDLRRSALAGCVMISQRAFDQLTFEAQQALVAAGAGFASASKSCASARTGGMLERQCVKRLVASESLRSAFLQAATRIRDPLDATMLPPPLLQRPLSILADYRAEHGRH